MTVADVDHRISQQTRRVQQVLRRSADAALQACGLTFAQYTVLSVVAAHPDASSAQIARDCQVSRQSLQDLMRHLREAGYVRVAEKPASGRSLPVRITPDGRRVLRRADRAMHRLEERMVAGISEREVTRVLNLLRRCAANLDH
jgi:DNA-binding MarR family transcriptional regulator